MSRRSYRFSRWVSKKTTINKHKKPWEQETELDFGRTYPGLRLKALPEDISDNTFGKAVPSIDPFAHHPSTHERHQHQDFEEDNFYADAVLGDQGHQLYSPHRSSMGHPPPSDEFDPDDYFPHPSPTEYQSLNDEFVSGTYQPTEETTEFLQGYQLAHDICDMTTNNPNLDIRERKTVRLLQREHVDQHNFWPRFLVQHPEKDHVIKRQIVEFNEQTINGFQAAWTNFPLEERVAVGLFIRSGSVSSHNHHNMNP